MKFLCVFALAALLIDVGYAQTPAQNTVLQTGCAGIVGFLPPSAQANLTSILNVSPSCFLHSCGNPQQIGYGDIVCDSLCRMAVYSGGTCTQNALPTPYGGTCICNGILGNPAILTTPLLCGLLANCVCKTCAAPNGTPYNSATCTNSYSAQGQLQGVTIICGV